MHQNYKPPQQSKKNQQKYVGGRILRNVFFSAHDFSSLDTNALHFCFSEVIDVNVSKPMKSLKLHHEKV